MFVIIPKVMPIDTVFVVDRQILIRCGEGRWVFWRRSLTSTFLTNGAKDVVSVSLYALRKFLN